MSINIGNQVEALRNWAGQSGVYLGESLDAISGELGRISQSIININNAITGSSSGGTGFPITDGIFTHEELPSKIDIYANATLGVAFQVEATLAAGLYTTELFLLDPGGSSAIGGFHVAAASAYVRLANGSYSIQETANPTNAVSLITGVGGSITDLITSTSVTSQISGSAGDITISPTKILPNPTLSAILGDSTHIWNSVIAGTYLVYNNGGNANTILSLSGAFNEITMSATSSSGAAGRARMTASNAAATFFTQLELDGAAETATMDASCLWRNPSLAVTGLILRDASGTTTGNSFEIQRNDGVAVFKVIGSTDAGAPGTVVTRDVVPFTDALYNLGNVTHRWSLLYGSNIDLVSASLGLQGIVVKDASGTTTAASLELKTNSGTTFFKVIGGTDASQPGTVTTRDVVPFTNALYNLGDVTHRWNLIFGSNIDLISASLGLQGIVIKDASGTTTAATLELKTNGGTTFFKVVGGTDASTPGTVFTRDVISFTDNTYQLGNSSHYWLIAYVNNLAASGDMQLSAGGNIVFANVPKFNTSSTGGGSASLGANSPAITNTAPYTWLNMKAPDGSLVYVPAWK